MKAIEFYTTPEGDVTMRPVGEAERQLKETDEDFVQAFLGVLREFYPEAYEALWRYILKALIISDIGIL